MNTAVLQLGVRSDPSCAMAVTKCGLDLHRVVTMMFGPPRQTRWREARGIGRPDPTRFALMLASERKGQG